MSTGIAPVSTAARRPAPHRAALALLLAAALLGAAAAGFAVSAAFAGGGREVAANVVASPNGPDQLVTARNSPVLVRNPRDPNQLVIVDRVDRPRYTADLNYSTDGGRNWRHTPLPLPAGRDRPYAPDATFTADGTLYVSYVNLEGVGNDPQSLFVVRSTDGGATLSAPVKVADHLIFQPRIVAGARGTIYLTWLQGTEVGTLSLVGPPAAIVAVRSTDGGQTFSAPVQVSDPSRVRVGAASPVIDSGGDLVVLYEDFKNDVRDFQNLAGPAWDQPFALVVTHSSDGARTFTPGVELESGVVATERFLVYLPPFPSIAAGPDRSLYVAWSDGRSGNPDVYLRRSPDGGMTWQPAVRVNDDPRGDGATHKLPKVAVAPNGRVDVVFLDGRRDPRKVRLDAELATSDDQGATFTNMRLSSTSFDSTIGPRTGPAYLGTDLGSRLGLVSGSDGAVAAWTDTRQGTADTGQQDIFTARVSLPSGLSAASRLAIAAGLLVAALLALGARLIVVRRGAAGRAAS